MGDANMSYQVLESRPTGTTLEHITRDNNGEPPYPRTFWARVAYVLPNDDITHVAEGIVTETLDAAGQVDQNLEGEDVCGPHGYIKRNHLERSE